MNPNIYLGLGLVLLTGCAENPYATTYRPSSSSVLQSVAQRREQPSPTTPELVKGTDPKHDWATVCSDGYVVIGQSKISGPNASDAQAIAQAKTVGADRVLVYRGLGSTEHDAASGAQPAGNDTTHFAPNGRAMIAGSAWDPTIGAGSTGNVPTIWAVFLVKQNRAFGATCSSPPGSF